MLVVLRSHAAPEQIDRVLAAIRALGLTPHPMPGPTRTAIGITGNTIAGNEIGGILIANEVLNNVSGGVANLSQAIGIDHNTIAYNGGLLFISDTSAVVGGTVAI